MAQEASPELTASEQKVVAPELKVTVPVAPAGSPAAERVTPVP